MSLMKVAVMVATSMVGLFCVCGAADIGSLVAQLNDPLMKEIIGSMRVEFQSQIEIERKDKEVLRAHMQEQIDDDKTNFQNQIDIERMGKGALRADMQGQIDSLVTMVKQHTTQLAECVNASDSRRNLQSQGPASQGEVVRLFRRDANVLHPSLHGGGTATGGGGHRRWLQEAGSCDLSTMKSRVDSINEECCDEPGEDCTGGKLSTCNEDCAAVLVPLWHDCEAELADDAELVREAVAMCPGGASSAVTKFMVTCPPGEILDHCIPNCDASTSGDVLMLTQNGNDMRLLCTLANFLYSWVGASALGGFLGEDVAAFVSAVISGAAGTYALTLMGDADVGTDLTIQPGQTVIINGDPTLVEAPNWGSGGFAVEEMGSLALAYVQLDVRAQIAVTGGGSLSLANMVLPALTTTLAGLSGAGSRLALDLVTVPEHPELGVMTGTVTAGAGEARWVLDPPGLLPLDLLPPTFTVVSGPCTLAQGGRCVGRWPGGYLPSEACEIAVGGGGSGALGPCPVFDTDGGDVLVRPGRPGRLSALSVFLYKSVLYGVFIWARWALNSQKRRFLARAVPDGGRHDEAECPAGAVLAAGHTLTWHTDSANQGLHSGGNALPYSASGAGGGWQICFT
jgi:hypothetical protein